MTGNLIDLDEALKRHGKTSRSVKAPKQAPNDNRPVIQLVTGQLEATVDAAETALISARRGIYQRANRIVCIGTAPSITADRQLIKTKMILPIGDYRLLELLMSSAAFQKWDARSSDFVPANAPMNVISALQQRRGCYRFPPLTGIISAPTMRNDGTLLSEPGYDDPTGLLFEPGQCLFPTIPERPTKTDAEHALATLKHVFKDFPFVAEADRSVALSYILTCVIRRSLRTSPMHAFTSTVAGSGKSKIVDIGSVIVTGREAGVISVGKKEEESEKRIASLLFSGSPIAIDNVETELGGDLLCQLLTQTSVRPRILGKSKVPELPTDTMVTATGNNLQIAGDLTRRTLICRLDPGVERPEDREFEFEPVSEAKANRGTYVAAALTILRAYHTHGRPPQPQIARLGSFEEWSDLVRSALVWLDCADPVETIEQGRSCDPRLEALRTVLQQWFTIFGSDPTSCADAIKRASERHLSFESDPGDFKHPELRDALMSVAAEGGHISSIKLGTWLRKQNGRVVDRLRFEGTSMNNGVKRWLLVEAM